MLASLVLAALLQTVPDTGRTASGLWYSVTGSGPTVLLIHGANLDSRSWGPLPDSLAGTHRVVRMDLRSHGRSRDAAAPFSWIDDVVEVLDAAGAERAALIGHSLGASVALDVALRHPGRVSGLVLVGPGISGMPGGMPTAGYESFMAALQKGDLALAGEELGRAPFARFYRDTTRQAEVRTIIRENVRLFRASRDWIKPLDPPAIGRLAEIKVPVLVLRGDDDPSPSNQAGGILLEQVKGATGERFQRCGHMLQLDCTGDVIASVRGFLARLAR